MSEKILEMIRNGELYVIHCEPLADFHKNLLFCPQREECERLYEYCEEKLGYEVHDIIVSGYCHFCESKDWIIVLADKTALITLLAKKEFAEEVLKAIEDFSG